MAGAWAGQVVESDRLAEIKSHAVELQEVPKHPAEGTRAMKISRNDGGIRHEREQRHAFAGLMQPAVVADPPLGEYAQASSIRQRSQGGPNARGIVARAIHGN